MELLQAYPGDGIALESLVEPLLHLVAIVVRVEDLLAVQVTADPQDSLTVQLQGACAVLLLYPLAEQFPSGVRMHMGQTRVNRIDVILVYYIPGKGAQKGMLFGWTPAPSYRKLGARAAICWCALAILDTATP